MPSCKSPPRCGSNWRASTPDLGIRPLVANDVSCILALDALTLGDYPGGVATALKAAAIIALASAGVDRVRTGGSMSNTAIIRTNEALGFVLDEHWVTLEA